MTVLIVAIAFTLGASAMCSLMEAFILSSTTAEIEDFKRRHPKLGELLQRFKTDIDETSSAILTLNTIANSGGAIVVGAQVGELYPDSDSVVAYFSGAMVFGILFFSEIIPKNLGVAYRVPLQYWITIPLHVVRIAMFPLSYVAKHSVRLMITKEEPTEEEQEKEIILLAEKSAKDGALDPTERDMISNALSLDNVKVTEIMTPRTVVTALEHSHTVEEVFRDFRNIPFARMPVYKDSIDNVVGMVRRRELLQAYGDDRLTLQVVDFMADATFVPEHATALDALQQFLKKHQQLAIVVDEFGSMAGVITMEDIIESLLGQEIFEDSDIAVDMRDLARKQARKQASRRDQRDAIAAKSDS